MPEHKHDADRQTKKQIANGIYLLFIGIVLCITVLAYQTFSLSWFATNSKSPADGLFITASAVDGASITSIDVYSVTARNDTTYTYTTDNPPLNLPRHDPAGIGYLEFQPAVLVKVVCEVSTSGCSLRLYGTQTPNLFGLANSMSNIATIRTAQPTTPTSVSVSASAQDMVSQSQINTTTGNVTSKNTIDLGTLFVDTNTIWFVIEYNPDLMPLINDALSMHIDLAGQDAVFAPDLMLSVESSANPSEIP